MRPLDGVPSRSTRIAVLVSLAIIVWVVFLGVLENGWILFDDHEYVTRNPYVQAGFTWEGFTWFLRTVHVGNWHPLTSWSHMLAVEVYGTSARGPHAWNLALHALAAVMLAHVLFLYTRRFFTSVCVATLFALHPLRVESVAWIAERKDVLSGCFFVATLWAWKGFVDRPGARRLALTTMLLLLGLMSKSMLVTVPFVLLLLDVWPLERTRSMSWGSLVREKWPLFALSAVFVLITLFSQAHAGATADIADITLVQRTATALTAYARYLAATIWPVHLAPIYPYEYDIEFHVVAFSLIVVAGISALVVRARTSRPHLAVGWLWFLGTLVPVIGIVQVGSQSHADRYTYLPSIGLALALVFEIASFVSQRRTLRVPAVLAFGAIAILLAALTRAQTALWRDTRTLFDHTLRVTEHNPVAQKIYGDMLLEEGDAAGSLAHFEEALRLAPNLKDGHKNLGCALAKLGRFDAAAEQFQIAREREPSIENEFNLAWALGDAGRNAEAIAPFERVIARDETNAIAHMRLGMVLANCKRFDEALVHWRRAIALDPRDLDSRRSIAMVHRARGEFAAEIAAFEDYLRAAPDDVDALIELARLRATRRDPAQRDGPAAVRGAERARELAGAPTVRLLGTLAAAHAEVGRFEEAVEHAARALELARLAGDPAEIARCEFQLAEHRAMRPLREP